MKDHAITPTDHRGGAARRAEQVALAEDSGAYAVRTCRGCGCTDTRACPGGCSWVEDDLCSACQETGR